MKKIFLFTLTTMFALSASLLLNAQTLQEDATSGLKTKDESVTFTPKEKKTQQDSKKENPQTLAKSTSSVSKSPKFSAGAFVGAVTVDGKNYQQLGLRGDFAIWKFGIGLDLYILLDEKGKVRKEDWDDWQDYLDKIYYVRWGLKGDPFYIKYGGLDYTYLGYNILVNGYSNMIEYPNYKRQGIDLSFDTQYVGGEMIVSNVKELFCKNPSVMGGARIYGKPISRLQIGVSFAGDLNEYKGLRDSDGDGYPDKIDKYVHDEKYVTEYEYYQGQGLSAATLADLTAHNVISGITRNDLTNYGEKTSRTGFWAADTGFAILRNNFINLDIYTQFAQSINTLGWGFTLPGVRLRAGWLTFVAEYKQNSDKFIFGYYNETYDIERARFQQDLTTGNLTAITKKDTLLAAKAGKGYYLSLNFNILNFAFIEASFQDIYGDKKNRSLTAKAGIDKNLIPKVNEISAYYIQNNVESLAKWKTPSTIIGATIAIDMGGHAVAGFDYLVTFDDLNGDGEIKGSDETLFNIQLKVSSQF